MQLRIQIAGDAHHASRGGRIRNGDHEQSRPLNPQRAQDLLARCVTVERRLALTARPADGLRIQLDDEIRSVDRPQRRGQIAAVQPVTRDDHVVRDGILDGGEFAWSESGQQAVQRNELLQDVEDSRSPL